jgi:hypothetical protein
VPFFGAFRAAWDDAMVARWSADPLGMLWPQVDTAFATSVAGRAARSGAPPGGRHRGRIKKAKDVASVEAFSAEQGHPGRTETLILLNFPGAAVLGGVP